MLIHIVFYLVIVFEEFRVHKLVDIDKVCIDYITTYTTLKVVEKLLGGC